MDKQTFRVWDKSNKKWEDPRGILFDCYDRPYVNIGGHALSNSQYVRVPSTGRLDRNGEEVFKGDVIDYANPEPDVHAVVVWDEEAAGWAMRAPWGENYALPYWQDMVVVDNVYENPELLEDAQ